MVTFPVSESTILNVLYLLAAIVVGGFLTIQGLLNSRLSQSLDHPLQASFISFSVALVALVSFMMLRGIALPSISLLKPLPPYLFAGGLLGLLYVTTVLLLMPKIGVTNVIFAIFVGQTVISLLVDHSAVSCRPAWL
ncbi:MAG: hypothetical protein COA84_07010 [Robiginitomaculum sp.]|nr:MAG: hypothetical protein COA84_07010 [Robiginitomaculum sp.]